MIGVCVAVCPKCGCENKADWQWGPSVPRLEMEHDRHNKAVEAACYHIVRWERVGGVVCAVFEWAESVMVRSRHAGGDGE